MSKSVLAVKLDAMISSKQLSAAEELVDKHSDYLGDVEQKAWKGWLAYLIGDMEKARTW